MVKRLAFGGFRPKSPSKWTTRRLHLVLWCHVPLQSTHQGGIVAEIRAMPTMLAIETSITRVLNMLQRCFRKV